MERVKESWEQAVIRLARTARERGIAIYCHDLGQSPEFFATSASRPGTLHRVTMFSCDCAGFIRHQRCTHHARLLDEVGELPTPPAATMAAVAIVCNDCEGEGSTVADDRHGRSWDVSCKSCRGRGRHTIQVAVADLSTLDHWGEGVLRGFRCDSCHGYGFKQMQTGGHLTDWEPVECRTCKGAGMVPGVLPTTDRIAA